MIRASEVLKEALVTETVRVWVTKRISALGIAMSSGRAELAQWIEHTTTDLVLALKVKMEGGQLNEVSFTDQSITYDMAPRTPWETAKWLVTTILDTYPALGRWFKWRHKLASSTVRYKVTSNLTQFICPHTHLPAGDGVHRHWMAGKLPVVGTEWEWTEMRKLVAELDAALGAGDWRVQEHANVLKAVQAFWRFKREREIREWAAANPNPQTAVNVNREGI